MSEYISREAVADVLKSFYWDAKSSKAENLIIRIKGKIDDIPSASVMEVRRLPHNPAMDKLLEDAGWE